MERRREQRGPWDIYGQNGTWKVKNEKEEPIDGIDERLGHMNQRIEQLV